MWDLRRPPSETGIVIDDDENDVAPEKGTEAYEKKVSALRKAHWARLRAKTTQIIEKTSFGKQKYWSPAIGK